MIPRLWRPYVRVRQWWRDLWSVAEARDRAVRAEWECTRLRQERDAAVDQEARQRLAHAGCGDEVALLHALIADYEETLAALGVADLPETQP